MTIEIQSTEDVCANCVNYHQHYGRRGNTNYVQEINFGHCHFPRIKERKPGCAACKYFRVRG